LTRSGNARVRRALIQLTWRFLLFQKGCALVQWYQARVAAKGVRRSTMIVALARKLLVALWRMVTTGVVPAGLKLRPAAWAAGPKQPAGTTYKEPSSALDPVTSCR